LAKRLVTLLSVLTALVCASVAAAAPMRPMLQPGPFHPLAHFTPADAAVTCLNGFPCYMPQEIQAAYNYPAGLGAPTGVGQTMVVVTAYGAPFVANDLQIFDAGVGLPDPPHFRVETQQLPVSTDGSGATYIWQVETDLDVQWAHAMAPGANVVVAVANTDDPANVAEVLREVLPKYPGAIVTQSFGADETGPASDPTLPNTFSPLYLLAILRGGTVLASAGDLGASNGTELEDGVTPSAMAAYPASDPLVLAVGGTEGNPYPGGLLTPNGTYGGEQAWNEVVPGLQPVPGAGGGAPSQLFDAPPWQRSLHTNARLEPDVSYNASEVDGYLVILSCRPNKADGGLTLDPNCVDSSNFGYVAVGGTSAGTPQWAAIIALANQLRAQGHRGPLGFVSPTLYDIAKDPKAYARDFHDITTGNNALDLMALGFPAASQFGFAAAPGYDLATGLGSPNVSNLLFDLQKRDSGNVPGNLLKAFKAIIKGHGKKRGFDPSK
jgi:subtilase family serine protease